MSSSRSCAKNGVRGDNAGYILFVRPTEGASGSVPGANGIQCGAFFSLLHYQRADD